MRSAFACWLVVVLSSRHVAGAPAKKGAGCKIPPIPIEHILAAANLQAYAPKFKAYGATTFKKATRLTKDKLKGPKIGMNEWDATVFAETMIETSKSIRECAPRFCSPLPAEITSNSSHSLLPRIPSPLSAPHAFAAGCKHKGWAKDALKGLVGMVQVAHVAAGAAAESISEAVSAGWVQTHAFLTDEERVKNAKKVALNAKDMLVTAAQAACAMVRLSKMVKSVPSPPDEICKACELGDAVAAKKDDKKDDQEATRGRMRLPKLPLR